MLKNENKRAKISNHTTLDAKNPIPFEPTGDSMAFLFSGKKQKYIPFLAPKDNFFQLLLEAKLLSPTNNSCVNSKAHYCSGNGFIFNDDVNEELITQFEAWSKRVNKKGQNFLKVVKSVFVNHFTVGNNFLEIIRGKVGSTHFIKVVNRPFLDCRLSEPDEDDISTDVIISKKFRSKNAWNLVENQVVRLPIYYGQDLKTFKWHKDSKQGTEHCIIHLKNEVSGYEHYGMPDNVSSLPWQIMEYKSARYNLDNFENNLVIGGVVFVSGNLSNDEAKDVGKDIIYSHTGDGKRGRWAVVSGQNIDAAKSGIQSFDTHKEGSYIELDNNTVKKIIDSNNWDAALFGQHNTTGLGNGGFAYMNSIYEIKKETVIKPTQTTIINDFIKPFFEIYDNWCNTKFSDLKIAFKEVRPVTVVGAISVNKIITKDEGRKILGWDALEDEETGKSMIEDTKRTNPKTDV